MSTRRRQKAARGAKRRFGKRLMVGGAVAAGLLAVFLPLYILNRESREPYHLPTLASCQHIILKDISPSLRDEYTNQIAKRTGKPDYVPAVAYRNIREGDDFARTNATFNWDGYGMNIKGPFTVDILEHSFDGVPMENECDFISNVRHEYRHAEVLTKGLVGYQFGANDFVRLDGSFNEPLFIDFLEVDAISREINEPSLSAAYRRSRIDNYLTFYTNIWDHGERMRPEFVQNLQYMFFADWILDIPDLKRENGWYLQNPVTKRKFYLPERAIEKYGK